MNISKQLPNRRGVRAPPIRDRRIRWCHLSTIPGTTPHCFVSTEGDVNF